mmetsp:Transcript_68242/g.118884  ORF Transcript_68242/g.118884 Transcript_68242/m.118884 type:complete len:602 (-) Transcript_68242:186-1991(-)
MTPLRIVLLGCSALSAFGNMFDALDPSRKTPSKCANGCAKWSDLASDGNTRSQAAVDAKWSGGRAPETAGRSCASPGMDPGADGYWCYCRNTHDDSWAYCQATLGKPEQINLQVASQSAVVVSWVTFEESAPTNPPIVNLEGKNFTGVTHAHQTPSKDRTAYMHFVKLKDLQSRKTYTYTVQSGGSGAMISSEMKFRAPYSDGPTKINLFGDMGVYAWTNMGNLKKDCEDGTADYVIHIGDHAYNEGGDDEARGDAYMNMYQHIISQCPWVPVVGNHEYYDGEQIKRYQDSTWQNWDDIPSDLHALLVGGTLHAGASGSMPSGTARWFSVDMGLVHWVSLDLNVYFGTDSGSADLKRAQADWLKKDLAEANKNRKTVPWIFAGSHYPFYCSECATQMMTADWYANGFVIDANGTETEHPPMNATQIAAMTAAKMQCKAAARRGDLSSCDSKMALDVKASTDTAIKDLMPIIDQAGVDMYFSGHWHFYESLWPMGVPEHGTGGPPTQKSFQNPDSTIHVTTGNGGPPSKDSYPTPMQALRKQSRKYGYGRMTVFNETHALFEQVLNGWSDEGGAGEIFDSFMVVQPKHGPFTRTVEKQALVV